MRQVNGNTLQQMDKFKYLWLVFTSDGRRSAMRLIRELAELSLFCVSFIALAATKQELSNTAKLSVFNSIFVPILTYGHESWLMTERILTQVQAPKMGSLRRVHGVTQGRTEVRLRKKQVWRLRIWTQAILALNVLHSRKNLRPCCNFSPPASETARGALCPLVTPLVWHFAAKCAAVKFAGPECRTTSPNGENPTTLVLPCIQNAQRKTNEASPAG